MGLIKLLQVLSRVIADAGTVFDRRCDDRTAALYRVWQPAFGQQRGVTKAVGRNRSARQKSLETVHLCVMRREDSRIGSFVGHLLESGKPGDDVRQLVESLSKNLCKGKALRSLAATQRDPLQERQIVLPGSFSPTSCQQSSTDLPTL